MKRVLLVVCVLALVAMASAAYASDTSWLISIRGVQPGTFGSFGATVAVGVGTSTDTVQGWPTSAGVTAQAEKTGADTGFHARHDVAVNPEDTYAWDLKIGAKSDYNNTQIALCIWNNRTASLGVGGELDHSLVYRLSTGGHTVAWFSDLALQADAIAGLAGFADLTAGTWADTAVLMKNASAWSPSSASPGFYVLIEAVKSQTGSYADLASYRLEAAPVVVPEPGTLMALGSGFIGLAGFAIRRRRA